MKLNLKILITVLGIAFLLFRCVPVNQSTYDNSNTNRYYPDLKYINTSYKEQIRTVQLVKFRASQMISTNNPVLELGKNERLVLTFDDINDQQQQYFAKIYHCNKDWSGKSNLQAMDYLEEFNQFPIREFEFSFDTKLGYIHYEWMVPEVKLSGNYLIVVNNGNDERDIVLSERFMVYENKAGINYKISTPNVVTKRRTHQELEFEVGLGNINVLNPATDIQAVIRQNSNWIYSKVAPDPLRISNGNNQLTYKFYNGELTFPGNNEYRFFDISTVNFKGNGVTNINKESKPISITLNIDQERNLQAYREWQDRNGTFAIGNRERQNTALVSDYFLTEFRLEYPRIEEEIYVVGEFNNWHINNDSRMKFNPNTGIYYNNILLKQGYYEYSYLIKNDKTTSVEGDFYATENDYDILIYYHSPQLRYDRLIGYTQFNSRAAQ
ncbi:type IX secretion system plug protein [Marivirga arenosa]|uniref:DUF5103 domain-containing protein n=1 Tax=Marivirga arenosa TaxID=3059076 RepID=A0AA51ZX16_9BACT|nr:type IX secretion system plug protein domain-containing protein [Marivirga sp. BKB1-2]WNB18286.1 DUF5103 domain-containing protein [Marivirga sp. BKB1-2]